MTNNLESIVLGGGCFWCTEAIYNEVIGVEMVTPGYSGGTSPNPSYDLVCEGDTGHAEVVKVDFDPSIISLEKILEVFWDIHDPTSINRQGDDVGTQYRSVIFYSDENQLKVIKKSLDDLKSSNTYTKPIVTQIVKLVAFYPAEDYHKNYYSKNQTQPYCSLVISPKIKHFKEKFNYLLKPVS
jgi:methionine-S-sulfoxide reductase